MSSTFFCVNIELSLPEDVCHQLSKLASTIRQKLPRILYYVGDSGIPPHLTLHYMYLTEEALSQVNGLVIEVVSKHSDLELELGEIEFHHNGIISIPCRRSQNLQGLHEDTVFALETIRQNSFDPELKYNIENRPDFYKSYLEKYGYPFVLDHYRPHIALARISNTPLNKIKKVVKELNNSWLPSQIRADYFTVRAWRDGESVGSTIAKLKMGTS